MPTLFPTDGMERDTLRRELRARRRALTAAERRHAGREIAARFKTLPLFQRARRIGLYLPNDGEVDTGPVIALARAAGKHLCLPVLADRHHRRLHFVEWREGERLVKNRYGIPEPRQRRGRIVSRTRLDLVIVPLVAFDAAGTRLGMGGGYYDTTFAGHNHRRAWRRPRLIGIAYDFQRVTVLERSAWDVPLETVVTESGCLATGDAR